jgi:hypothetical protein
VKFQQLRSPDAKARSRIDPGGKSISAMIERVAQEQRLRRAASAEADVPAAAPAPATAAAPGAPQGIESMSVLAAPSPAAANGATPIVSCAQGHRFAALPDHPVTDGAPACPHCLARTVDEYRKRFAAAVLPPRFE